MTTSAERDCNVHDFLHKFDVQTRLPAEFVFTFSLGTRRLQD